MIPLLATDYSPPPGFTGWLACAFYFAAFIAMCAAARYYFRKPQPTEFVMRGKFTTAEEVEKAAALVEGNSQKRKNDSDKQIAQLRSEFEKFRDDWSENAESLRNKIDEKFSQAITANNASSSRVHSRIDGVSDQLNQVIGLLHGKVQNKL